MPRGLDAIVQTSTPHEQVEAELVSGGVEPKVVEEILAIPPDERINAIESIGAAAILSAEKPEL